jgi:hypothetical protein
MIETTSPHATLHAEAQARYAEARRLYERSRESWRWDGRLPSVVEETAGYHLARRQREIGHWLAAELA